MSQQLVSYHLRELRTSGFVAASVEGTATATGSAAWTWTIWCC
jgi:hypothetical protein